MLIYFQNNQCILSSPPPPPPQTVLPWVANPGKSNEPLQKSGYWRTVFWKDAFCSYVTDLYEIQEPQRVKETHTDIVTKSGGKI